MLRKLAFLLALMWPLASVEASDPDMLCETRTATIPVPEYSHCEKGDLVEIETDEVARRCTLSEPLVPLGRHVLCTYRGEKRDVRKRPLSDAEKAYDQEEIGGLIDKYSD